MKYLIPFACLLFLLSSCGKDEIEMREEQLKTDIAKIEAYLQANNLTAQKTVDGVYYIIENEGSSDKPKITSTLNVKYTGYLLSGKVFDSNNNLEILLADTYVGWQATISKFGKGGKGKLFIPSLYAEGAAPIEGEVNAVLAFDVEILDFK